MQTDIFGKSKFAAMKTWFFLHRFWWKTELGKIWDYWLLIRSGSCTQSNFRIRRRLRIKFIIILLELQETHYPNFFSLKYSNPGPVFEKSFWIRIRTESNKNSMISPTDLFRKVEIHSFYPYLFAFACVQNRFCSDVIESTKYPHIYIFSVQLWYTMSSIH